MPATLIEEVKQEEGTAEEVYNFFLKKIAKPEGFDHLEVKNLGRNHFRVSVITKIFKEENIFPILSRPKSWYVDAGVRPYKINPKEF